MPQRRSPKVSKSVSPGLVEVVDRADVATSQDLKAVAAARKRVSEDVHALLKAGDVLQEALRIDQATLRAGLDHLDSGMTIASVLKATDAGVRRQYLTLQLQAFEACRHRLRLSLSAAGIEEQMSIGELGRAFDVSRQLASRLVKEAQGR
jgi:hypothetical protein